MAESIRKQISDIWSKQIAYNELIKQETDKTHSEWILTYLLGLNSEISELLDELNWEAATGDISTSDEVSIALELADITKYVMCLWQHFGWQPDEVFAMIRAKSSVLEFKLLSERKPLPENQKVLVCDLDGTLADWRQGFLRWMWRKGFIEAETMGQDPNLSLAIDVDFGWAYNQYTAFKSDFEKSGGYRHLPPMLDTVEAIISWRSKSPDHKLFITTARPLHIARVKVDTYFWLKDLMILPDQLQLVKDARVQIALDLINRGNKVWLWDDDPELALRAAHNNIKVIMRRKPYNKHAKHPYIYRVDSYTKEMLP